MHVDVDRQVDALARNQHGVFNLTQVRPLGVTDSVVKGRMRSGRWLRLDPSVYALRSHPATWLQSCMAATLSVPAGLASGTTAAALHQLDGFRRGPLHVTTPPGSNERSRLATVHRSAFVRAAAIEGIPCLDPTFTILDLATFLWPDRLSDVIDRALNARQVTFGQLVAGFVLHANGRRHGTVALRQILDARDPNAAEPQMSELERLLRQMLRSPDLPSFVFEATPPWWPEGTARVDAYSAACALIVEADGRRWHTREKDFVYDRRRDNLAAAHGHAVLRFTYEDLTGPLAQVRRTVMLAALSRGWVRSAA